MKLVRFLPALFLPALLGLVLNQSPVSAGGPPACALLATSKAPNTIAVSIALGGSAGSPGETIVLNYHGRDQKTLTEDNLVQTSSIPGAFATLSTTFPATGSGLVVAFITEPGMTTGDRPLVASIKPYFESTLSGLACTATVNVMPPAPVSSPTRAPLQTQPKAILTLTTHRTETLVSQPPTKLASSVSTPTLPRNYLPLLLGSLLVLGVALFTNRFRKFTSRVSTPTPMDQ